MTLTSKPLAILISVILFGGIFFSNLMGWWATESSKVPAAYTEGEFAGQANPADIRGSYTFGDIEKNFAISPAILAQAFGVESDPPEAYALKNLEEQYAESPFEIGTSSVRLFVAFYNGLPLELSEDIYLPAAAVVLLQQRPLTPEQSAYLAAHTLETAPPAVEAETSDPLATDPAASEPQPTASEDRLIKGKTTFADLLAWGLTKEGIEQILGMPLPASNLVKVKDFCSENGLDFEIIKTSLQGEVDRLP